MNWIVVMSMDRIDLHKRRMEVQKIGDDFVVDNIIDDILNTFRSNPSYTTIVHLGETREVHIIDDNDRRQVGGRKILLSKPKDVEVEVGDFVELNGKIWLCTQKDTDNKIQSRTTIERTNKAIKLESGSQKLVKGYDSMDRPIYDEIKVYNETRTVASTRLQLGISGQDDEPIKLPEGRLSLCIPYKDKHGVHIDGEFEVDGENYIIKDIDFTNVIDGNGIINFIAHRRQK